MNAKNLGMFIACHERGYDPSDFMMKRAAMEQVEANHPQNVEYHRKVASAFYHLFEAQGKGQTKCARHFKALATHPEWSDNSQDTMDHVYDFLAGVEHFKEASTVVPAIAGGGKLLGVLSALFGGAAGVAYWQMKRSIQNEGTNNEVMKNQIGYYDQLTDDLERSMNVRHGYGEENG